MTGRFTTKGDHHLSTNQPEVRSAEVADHALRRMSASFESRDLGSLLDSFSEHASATYAGSEVGEIATGARALREVLAAVLSRDVHYSFTLSAILAQTIGEAIWVLADGSGHEASPDGAVQSFPYRACGILLRERGDWRWALLSCSEPIGPPNTDGG